MFWVPKFMPKIGLRKTFIKCHQAVFLWWGLVPNGDMMLYFHCTIFAGLEMGTLVARQFLQTMKIFFQKKKPIRPTLAWTLAPKTPRDPLFLLLSMIIGVIKIVELCSDFSYGLWFKRYAQKNEGPLAAP